MSQAGIISIPLTRCLRTLICISILAVQAMFRTNELQTFYKHGFVGTSQKSAYNINARKIKNPENPMISGLRAFDFFNTAEREAPEPK